MGDGPSRRQAGDAHLPCDGLPIRPTIPRFCLLHARLCHVSHITEHGESTELVFAEQPRQRRLLFAALRQLDLPGVGRGQLALVRLSALETVIRSASRNLTTFWPPLYLANWYSSNLCLHHRTMVQAEGGRFGKGIFCCLRGLLGFFGGHAGAPKKPDRICVILGERRYDQAGRNGAAGPKGMTNQSGGASSGPIAGKSSACSGATAETP
jgi:hypothetical protein